MAADAVLHLGDCLTLLPTLAAASVDAIVTDPPYNLTDTGRSFQMTNNGCSTHHDGATRQVVPRKRGGFMGLAWDATGIAFRPETWAAVLRVVKPGGYMLTFGGTRTFHRIACAIEDAGWRLTDTLCWLHGQGFPKSRGQLKPAWEPILLARAPGRGVRPLNIDECRVAAPNGLTGGGNPNGHRNACFMAGDNDPRTQRAEEHPAGRYPANLCLSHHEQCRRVGTKRVKNKATPYTRSVDAGGEVYNAGCGDKPAGQVPTTYADADGLETVEVWECARDPQTGEYICPVALLDEQSGERPTDVGRSKRTKSIGYGGSESGPDGQGYGDSGGASRFFFTSKASRRDRGEGNTHPTVKSTALCEWLIKLVARAGETVLDPFAGSGSTLVAAQRCGRNAIGIEQDPAYAKIARRRIAAARKAVPCGR